MIGISTYRAPHIIFIALGDVDSVLLVNKKARGSVRPVFNHSIVNATVAMEEMSLLDCLFLNYDNISSIDNCNGRERKSDAYSQEFLE